MELEVVLVVVIPNSFSVLPLHDLLVVVVVPALRLIKGHEKQHKLPCVQRLALQRALFTHQQRTNQAGVDVPLLQETFKKNNFIYTHPGLFYQFSQSILNPPFLLPLSLPFFWG